MTDDNEQAFWLKAMDALQRAKSKSAAELEQELQDYQRAVERGAARRVEVHETMDRLLAKCAELVHRGELSEEQYRGMVGLEPLYGRPRR